MFYKVQSVKSLPEYGLLVIFESGEKRQYNVKPLFDKWESPSKPLQTPTVCLNK